MSNILPGFVLLPILFGLLAWASERFNTNAPRWIALIGMLSVGVLLWKIWPAANVLSMQTAWADFKTPWIPSWGASFHFTLDGLSALMVLLAALLGAIAVLCSWQEVKTRIGLFHLHLSLMLAAVISIFLAADLLLFFVSWEVALIPMYFLITLWGNETQNSRGKMHAGIKFLIYGQASGLLMLLSSLALVFFHAAVTRQITFDYAILKQQSLVMILQQMHLPPEISLLVMLGFFIAFVVKLPAVPFHGWLADAHEHAPTGASVDITGLLLKTSAYGLLRFCLPLFPEASHFFAPIAFILGVVSIGYGGVLAFGQTHLKRLIAYTSISHMGFILIGIYAFNIVSLQGVVVMMIAGALSSAGLFILAGQLYERLGTFDLREMGGLWSRLSLLPAFILFFAAATLGLPGLGNFIGEFLVLLGAFKITPLFVSLATIGMILAAIYALALVHRTIYGSTRYDAGQQNHALPAITLREQIILWALAIGLLAIGLFPQWILNISAMTMMPLAH